MGRTALTLQKAVIELIDVIPKDGADPHPGDHDLLLRSTCKGWAYMSVHTWVYSMPGQTSRLHAAQTARAPNPGW